VAEEEVVVLAEEADRRGRGGVRARRVGDVEELLAVVVGEGPQAAADGSTTSLMRVSPDQFWMSLTVAGPKAAR